MISIGNGFTNVAVLVPNFTCQGKNVTNPSVCFGRGYCYDQDQCSCEQAGWTGSDCNTPICQVNELLVPCDGHGVCVAPNTCVCQKGYYGVGCETYFCFGVPSMKYGQGPSPCSGRGACTGPDTCQCNSPEYYGDACQFKRCFSGNGSFGKRKTMADRLCNHVNSQILDIPYPIPTGNMTGYVPGGIRGT